MNKSLWIVVAIVVVIVAGGAGFVLLNKHKDTTSSQSSNSSMSDMSSSSQSSTSSNPTATDKVTITNFAFSPASITVKKGTTVTWTNQDSTAHTVTENDGKTGPNSGTLENGKSYSFTYDSVGTFSYHCTFHSSMTGNVVVTE